MAWLNGPVVRTLECYASGSGLLPRAKPKFRFELILSFMSSTVVLLQLVQIINKSLVGLKSSRLCSQ